MRNDEIQTDLVEIPTIKGLLNKKGDNTTVAMVVCGCIAIVSIIAAIATPNNSQWAWGTATAATSGILGLAGREKQGSK